MDFIFVKSKKKGMDGYGAIYARIRNACIVKKIPIDYIIKETEWEAFRAKKYRAEETLESLNLRYGVFANVMEQIKGYLEEETSYDKAYENIQAIKMAIPSSMEVKQRKKSIVQRTGGIMLVDFLRNLKAEYVSGERLKTQSSKQLSRKAIQHYTHLITTLVRFQEACELQFTLDDIDLEWREEFISWCMYVSMSTNTINSIMYTLRTSLRIANENKLTKNEVYLMKGFVPSKDVVDQIYLSPQRIKEMYELDLSKPDIVIELAKRANLDEDKRQEMERQLTSRKPKSIEMVRDIFMVGCFTGQRFSDYARISSSMIKTVKGTRFIDIVQQKTGKEVYIPLDKRVKRILDKYNGVLPSITPNVFNFNLRLIAELLGWTEEPGFDEKSMKGKLGPRFCDMISSHTARRSFATNAYEAKVPLSSIMAITGHSSEEKLRVYLKLQSEEKAVMAAKDFAKIMMVK